jgi:hypothetical protein
LNGSYLYYVGIATLLIMRGVLIVIPVGELFTEIVLINPKLSWLSVVLPLIVVVEGVVIVE